MGTYGFANLLFSGPCNQACPDCIGRRLGRDPGRDNLDEFPPRGLDAFLELLRREGVTELSLTGTDTDPQLYRHEVRLLALLRARLPGVRLSLHTNGRLALPRMDAFNAYDRATISLPSFRADTCRALTGRGDVLPLAAILARARIPIKVSVLVTPRNLDELADLLARCAALGVRRAVLRRRYPDGLSGPLLPGVAPTGVFHGNPVYRLGDLEVTEWDFHRSTLRCLNLFADGTIADEYLLERSAHGRRDLPPAA